MIHRGEKVSIHGNGFSGIERLAFLGILRDRCRELGVDLRFNAAVTDPAELMDADLLLGADGANSLLRRAFADFFQPSVDVRQNRYVWLGTRRLFHGLVMIFRQNEAGLFIAHAYKFSPTHSTFIVEASVDAWLRAGLDRMSPAETCAYLAGVFADDLGGEPLLSNNFVRWLNFPLVKNRRWHHRHMVLVGDAAHTAHFSIGSGTKLALEDAIALARALRTEASVAAALPAFEAARKPVVDAFQAAALKSLVWLENVEPHLGLEPIPFAYKHMMRSQRIGYARLKLMDPGFTARYDAWRAAPAGRAGPIPADFLDLFEKPTFAHLATPDGRWKPARHAGLGRLRRPPHPRELGGRPPEGPEHGQAPPGGDRDPRSRQSEPLSRGARHGRRRRRGGRRVAPRRPGAPLPRPRPLPGELAISRARCAASTASRPSA